ALECRIAPLARDARAAVGYLQQESRVVGAEGAAHAATVRGEFERVREQVEQHALELVCVDLRSQPLGRLDGEGDAPLRGERAEVAGDAPQQVRHIHLGVLQPCPVGLEPGYV